MTNQYLDVLVYEGEEYELLGDYTDELPMLDRYGFVPTYFSTACVRGYAASYVIDEGILYLSSLMVHDANKHYPNIGGVDVKFDLVGRPIYDGLHERMKLTGQIVIGERLASAMSRKRNIVRRLSFDDGELQAVEDITSDYSALARKIDKIFAERNSIWMRWFASESKRSNHRKQELNELFSDYITLLHGLAREDQNFPIFK